MKQNSKIALTLVALAFGVLGVSACMQGTTGSESQAERTSSGGTKMASIFRSPRASGDSSNPLEAHMRARRMVDPRDTSLTHEYTTLAVKPSNLPPKPKKKPGTGRSFMTALSSLITPEPETIKPAQKPDRASTVVSTSETNNLETRTAGKKSKIRRLSAQEIKKAQSLAMRDAVRADKPAHKPAHKPEFKKPPKPGSVSLETAVSSVRIGNYTDKTRVVMDLNGPAKFDYDRQSQGRSLKVNLPGVSWHAQSEKRFSAHPLLENYEIKTTKKGSTLIIKTKKPARLIQSSYLPPNHLYGHRIYFDIAPI